MDRFFSRPPSMFGHFDARRAMHNWLYPVFANMQHATLYVRCCEISCSVQSRQSPAICSRPACATPNHHGRSMVRTFSLSALQRSPRRSTQGSTPGTLMPPRAPTSLPPYCVTTEKEWHDTRFMRDQVGTWQRNHGKGLRPFVQAVQTSKLCQGAAQIEALHSRAGAQKEAEGSPALLHCWTA